MGWAAKGPVLNLINQKPRKTQMKEVWGTRIFRLHLR